MEVGLGPLMKEHDLPKGLPEGLPQAVPEGFCLIRAGNARITVKEEYAGAFSDFTLPDIEKPKPGGYRSGRGRLTSISLTPDSGERAVVRRYIRGGFLGRFWKELYLDIGRSRPLRELLISEYARKCGVSTPEVVCAVVEKASPFFYRGALVTREIAPGADVQEEALAFAPRDRATIRGKRRCIESLGRLIAQMHDAGIYHADLHLKNVLKSGQRLYVLDLDAARIRNPLPDYQRRMNLLRLYRSVEKINRRRRVITQTDLLRFVKAYASESQRAAENLLKDLLRMLPLWRLKWRLSDFLKV